MLLRHVERRLFAIVTHDSALQLTCVKRQAVHRRDEVDRIRVVRIHERVATNHVVLLALLRHVFPDSELVPDLVTEYRTKLLHVNLILVVGKTVDDHEHATAGICVRKRRQSVRIRRAITKNRVHTNARLLLVRHLHAPNALVLPKLAAREHVFGRKVFVSLDPHAHSRDVVR